MLERYSPQASRPRLIRGKPLPILDSVPPVYLPFVASAKSGHDAENRPSARQAQLELIGYCVATILISALTEPGWLTGALGVLLILAGRESPALLRRAALATLTFSAVVSLAYVIQVLWLSGGIPWHWLLTVNLRVFVMAFLTFLFIRHVNLFVALSFSRRLSFMLVLAVSQALGLRRTLDDFRLAMQSRGPRRARLRDRYRAVAHAAGWLLDKALANAHESAQALQSRGVFR